MGKSELIIAIAVCLLLSGGAPALALEEHEGAEGKVVEIKSQEDVDELMKSIDFNGDSTYLLITGRNEKSSCHGCHGTWSDTACKCDKEYAPEEPCCKVRTTGCPSSCHDGSDMCVRDQTTGKLVANRCGV
jgi:hypothetical protein